MPEEIEKINQIAHAFGQKLIQQGSNIIRTVFKLNPAVYNRQTIMSFLSQQTGLSPSTISLADEKYHCVSWAKWEAIKEYDLTDRLLYYADVFDCDNFAFLFSSLSTMNYHLNSAGVAFGNVYGVKTGALITRHAFNLIITQDEGGIMNLYLFEPQTDDSCLFKKGRDNIIERLGWRYVPDWLIFY